MADADRSDLDMLEDLRSLLFHIHKTVSSGTDAKKLKKLLSQRKRLQEMLTQFSTSNKEQEAENP